MILRPNEPERKKPGETEDLSEYMSNAGDNSPFAEAKSDFDRSQERMREIFLSIAENHTHSEANYTGITANLGESMRAFAISATLLF